jgi:hypothetical protein
MESDDTANIFVIYSPPQTDIETLFVKTVSTFSVQIILDSNVNLDAEVMRVAISDGFGAALHEGDVTEATAKAVDSWSVTHISSTANDPDPDVQIALATLRGRGYAVAAFSPQMLGKMTVDEMEPFLMKMGTEAIEDMNVS